MKRELRQVQEEKSVTPNPSNGSLYTNEKVSKVYWSSPT